MSLTSGVALHATTRLAPPVSRSRRALRVAYISIGVALLVHVLLAVLLFQHRSGLPILPAPGSVQEHPIDLEIQNDVGASGDKQVGGMQATENQQAAPTAQKANPAPPVPPPPPKVDAPDLVKSPDGEVAPPQPVAAPKPDPDAKVAEPPLPTVSQTDTPPDATKAPAEQTDPAPDIRLAAGEDDGMSGGSATVPAKADPKIRNRLPAYPTEAALKGQSGLVTMFVHVAPDGTTSVVVANSSGSASLDSAAIRAVQRWHFKPATAHGSPVASDLPVALNFVLH